MSATRDAATLLGEAPCNTVLPAGTGKTQLLAHACKQTSEQGGRTLFLTHTNAGVDVFRSRLRRLGVDASTVDIRTIASWCESWCRSYPILAALEPLYIEGDEFNQLTVGAARVLQTAAIQRVARTTWQVAVIDEYQDCTVAQHDVVCALADSVPTIVVGDPMQSVFDFNKVIDWTEHVDVSFARLQLEWLPHRWALTNPKLGKDLLEVRERIESNGPIDLRSLSSVRWVQHSNPGVANEVRRIAAASGPSIVLHKRRGQCVKTAKSGGGRLEAIEDVNRASLMGWASKMDEAAPIDRALIVASIIQDCASKLPSGFMKRAEELSTGKVIKFRADSKLGAFSTAAKDARETGDPGALFDMIEVAAEFPGIVIARRELWNDVRSTLRISMSSQEQSLVGAAKEVRDRSRRSASTGLDAVVVATPLLVKGLEYDHVLVVSAEQFSMAELYVSMTRACVSLTVISQSPVIASTT